MRLGDLRLESDRVVLVTDSAFAVAPLSKIDGVSVGHSESQPLRTALGIVLVLTPILAALGWKHSLTGTALWVGGILAATLWALWLASRRCRVIVWAGGLELATSVRGGSDAAQQFADELLDTLGS